MGGPQFVYPTIHQWTLNGFSSSGAYEYCTSVHKDQLTFLLSALQGVSAEMRLQISYGNSMLPFWGDTVPFSRVAAPSCNPISSAPGFQSPKVCNVMTQLNKTQKQSRTYHGHSTRGPGPGRSAKPREYLELGQREEG